MFIDKSILVTGGTGSFGNQITRFFLERGASQVRVFSRDEKKQHDMREQLLDKRARFFLGDVRDEKSLDSAMCGADFVFHAAALKQVPSCEFYPLEAVKTNVLGTDNVLRKAVQYGVKKVVILSTDKAVYPVNAMGQSKALMEKVMLASARHGHESNTIFCATRYGNVLASRGSVIPHFVQQLKSGSPVTITDPRMTRFLMSLDESVELVLEAFNNGNNGDIFVKKAPASTVETIAKALKEIFSSNSEIQIIGTRLGEKKHETLLSRDEMRKAIESKLFFRIPLDERNLNYSEYLTEGQQLLSEVEEYSSDSTQQLSVEELKTKLIALPFIKNHLVS